MPQLGAGLVAIKIMKIRHKMSTFKSFKNDAIKKLLKNTSVNKNGIYDGSTHFFVYKDF